MDWCFSTGQVIQESYGNMSAALNASGHAVLFNMCEWGLEDPWTWGDGIAQSWRMAGDHTGIWSSTKSTVRASAAIPANFSGRPYGWNDMDMLETGCSASRCAQGNGHTPNMTDLEQRTEFSMWAISASQLQFTAPLMNCTAKPSPPISTCNVSLVTQTSKAACVLGQSFGCSADNTSMWIDNGCRGDFMCQGVATTCDEDGAGQHVCQCGGSNDANVTCVPWITDLQREILFNKEVIAINQDVTPQGRPIKDGDLTVWARHLSDGSVGVAFYNENDEPATISVAFADLGFAAGTSAAVRDLWAHADLGSFTDRYPTTGGVAVAPHETHFVRITPS